MNTRPVRRAGPPNATFVAEGIGQVPGSRSVPPSVRWDSQVPCPLIVTDSARASLRITSDLPTIHLEPLVCLEMRGKKLRRGTH